MSQTTNDLNESPVWLTKTYLENALQNKYPKNLVVNDFTAEPAVSAGNNFISIILRVNVKCTENGHHTEHSLIIKGVHADEQSAQGLQGFYNHEIKMYSDILPRMQGLLKSIGDTEEIAPEAIFVDVQRKVLILPDLKKLKYQMEDRKIGLDWKHLKVVIRKQAKLHACSMILAEQGEVFDEFRKSLLFNEEGSFNKFFENMFLELGEEVELWSGYEKYGDKLKTLSTRIASQGFDVYGVKQDQMLALIHGDCWTNNVMFKDEPNGKLDATLIDFQLCYYGSPMFDMIYCYCTSVTDDLKFNPIKVHETLQVYHEHLAHTLERLGSTRKLPTLFEVHHEYYRVNFYYLICLLFSAIMLNDDAADFQDIVGDSEANTEYRKKHLFATERFIRITKYHLPLWDAQGLLDPLK